jgi:hypothetical protein
MVIYFREHGSKRSVTALPVGPVLIHAVSVSPCKDCPTAVETVVVWSRPDSPEKKEDREVPGTPQHALRLLEREFAKPGSLNRPLVNACLDKLWDTVVRGEK